jgi:hypothetical protein
LDGHEHVYARFAPLNPSGEVDDAHGIRQFIVGTGGESLDTLASPLAPTVQSANDASYGVMKLTLGAHRYAWDYEAANGTGFGDTGSGTCHGAPEGGQGE